MGASVFYGGADSQVEKKPSLTDDVDKLDKELEVCLHL